jgi:ribokinase
MQHDHAGRVAVVGSLVMDIVVRLSRRPGPGETLVGKDVGMFLGGKGFNQAVAARRAGADVSMIGRLGSDSFGEPFFAALDREGMERSGITVDAEAGTGVAIPMIDDAGENSIVVMPRANLRLTAEDIEPVADKIRGAAVLLLQLESSPAASLAAARLARDAGVRVLWNTAPLSEIPEELFQRAEIVIANELEAAALAGHPVTDAASAADAAAVLRARGVPVGVVTLGEQGLVAVTDSGVLVLPAHPVVPVDTTGAGDAFCGALAAQLAVGAPLETALRFANAAGALAVAKLGAEPSLPRRADVLALLRTARSWAPD